LSALNEETSETANNLSVANAQTESERLRQVFIETVGFDPLAPGEGVAEDKVVGQKAEAVATKEDPLKAFRSVITESPVTQIAGGMRDAISSTLDIPTDIFNLFSDIDKNGIGEMIPEIDKSDSTTLGVVRSAAQFMTDFVPAFRGLKGVKTLAKIAKKTPKVAGAIRGEIAGAIASAAAFDPEDPNISTMINQMVPALKNPVTEFLATDPNDEPAFNRLKQAVEGLGLGALTEGFLGAIRGVRAARGLTRLKDELKGDIEKKVKAATKKGEIESIEEGSFKSLSEESLDIESKIEALRDQIESEQGIKDILEQEEFSPELKKLEEQRLSLDTAIAQNAFDSGKLILEDILGFTDKDFFDNFASIEGALRDYGLSDKPQGGTFFFNQTTVPKLNKAPTEDIVKKMAAILFSKEFPNADFLAAFESNFAGITKKGKLGFLEKGEKIATEFQKKLKDVLLDKKPIPKVSETIEDIPSVDFSKAETPEQFNQAVADAKETFRKRFKQKRGVRPIETSKKAAEFFNTTPEKLAKTEKGTAFNAEQIIDAVNVVNQVIKDTEDFAQKIASGKATSADKVEFLKGTQLISQIDPVFFGVRGESGRATQSFTVAQPTIQRLNDIAEGMASREGGEMSIEQFAGMYLTLAKETSPKEVAKWLRITRRIPAMIKELFLSSLLSGPKTHIVNVMGNASTLFMAPLERGVAARLPMSTVVKGESTYMLFGMYRAWSDSIRLAGRTLKTGIAATDTGLKNSTKLEGFSTRQITSEAFELAKDSFAGRAVDGFGAVVSFPLRALLASDVFFKTMNRSAEISALAIRNASEQNLTGKEAGKFIQEFISDPDLKFVKKAEDFAAYQTFTNELGAFGKAVQNLANAHLWAKFFLPFVSTPVNIFKYSFERTPIGGIHASLKQAIRGTDPVARDLALARLAMGSAAAGVFATMTASGMITGAGPKNKEMRKIMKDNGWQENSFFINGAYFSYSRLDPVGQMIGDIADFTEASQYMKYTTPEDTGLLNVNVPFAGHTNIDAVALGIVMAYSKNMLSKTYVTGMQNALDLLEVGVTTGELGKSFAQARSGARKFTLSFIPTIAKDIRKSMDPILREADTFTKAWKANNPFHSGEGFPERNIFGEVIVRGHMAAVNNSEGTNKLLNGLATFINPLYITHDQDDIVMEELIKRDAIIGQMPNWIAGSKPTFSFEQSKTGEGIKLTDEQQDFWKIEAGKGAREEILRLMNSSGYRFKMSDFQKQEELKSILTNHRQDAKELMITRFGLRPLIDQKGAELDAARQVISELQNN